MTWGGEDFGSLCKNFVSWSLSVTYWFIHKYLQMFKVRTATDHKNITQLHNPRHTVKTHNRHVPCLHKGDASGFLQKI